MCEPLAGIRVIELAGRGPGPFGGALLADLGADVVRIEKPAAGSGHQTPPGLAAVAPLQRGKSILLADLTAASDLGLLTDLIDVADVVIDPFRPGVVQRLGLVPAELARRNPRLIFAHVTGWGQEGPYCGRAGHDVNYLAVSGALAMIGTPADPVIPMNLIADYGAGGMLLVNGILAALVRRSRTGVGGELDVAMIDGIALLLAGHLGLRERPDWPEGRAMNILNGASPTYNVYRTADGGHLAVAATEPPFLDRFLRVLGLDEGMAGDFREPEQWPELTRVVAGIIGARDRDEWVELFADADACVCPVLTLEEAFQDPHISARATYRREGAYTYPGRAPRFVEWQRAEVSGGDLAAGGVVTEPGRSIEGAEILARWAAGAPGPAVPGEVGSDVSFELPDELVMLHDLCRDFVDRELIPIEMTSLDADELRPHLRTALEAKARDLGLWLLDAPEELGGKGLGLLGMTVVWQQLARTVALPGRGPGIFGPDARLLLLGLNDDQVRRYAMPVLAGERRTAFAQTEPAAGADPGSMRTTAVRTAAGYLVNGSKHFISHAATADFLQLVVATDRSKGSRGGLSVLLVDMDTPGVRLGRAQKMMMGETTYEIFLDDVLVPVENLIGAEGDGMARAQRWLTGGRLYQASYGLGMAQRCIELAAVHARTRVTFGQPSADRQAIQLRIADAFIEHELGQSYLYRTAARADAGIAARHEPMVAKTFCTDAGFRAADSCLQIHGGMGLTLDLPIHKLWTESRSFLITEGAVEVMKATIARLVLRMGGTPVSSPPGGD